ncbi:MAG: hypothetical protein JXB19_06980 [Bacteroidales bacterium]|nr:hypothetical protein [Bacteroidales bacterium]
MKQVLEEMQERLKISQEERQRLPEELRKIQPYFMDDEAAADPEKIKELESTLQEPEK